ncbi:MAG TPA: hypothetical protein VMZ27_11560 [Candidatus Saccharimonadales bacterium]|nr:hypothetical protein [Candidatus Saccharimonadales bacterium]
MTSLALIASFIVLAILLIGGLAWPKILNSSLPMKAKNEARTQLMSLAGDLELPSYVLASGISDPLDLQFVRSHSPKLEKAFIKDRAQLARLWLQENRYFLNRLMRLHRLIARTNPSLSVGTELRVMAIGGILRGVLVASELLVLLAGPFRARHVASLAMGIFDDLSATVGSLAGTLDAGQKATIRADWARMA